LVRDDLAVITLELTTSILQVLEMEMEFLEILRSDHGRFRYQAEGIFHVDESDGAIEFEIQLGTVQKMKDREIVFTKTQVLKAVEKGGHLVKKI
jgi:hypothetical protein